MPRRIPISLAALLLAGGLTHAQNDLGYTRKILEYTTEPFFLTEFVDHLPASRTVPTPEKFLGHIIGAPDVLTTSRESAAYLRALDKASPRVTVVSMGLSEEGREMVVALISDEANLRKLDRLKEVNALLGDPRRIKGSPDQLIAEGIPFYWATGGMHAPESGPPEATLELAYRLAVSERPEIRQIRKSMVVMLTPVLDVDGRERAVDLYRYRKANPTKPPIPLVYWGKYVAHDSNRDAMGMGLNLSKALMKTWLDFKPLVLHDLHESVPYLYTSTGTGPYNAWLDPIVISEWQELAYHEIQQLTERGVPGVWTHGFYDGWAPSYGFYVANGHNGIGRFYETFSGGGADTGIRSAVSQSTRAWYRPNPPFPRVRWSIRNNVNLMQSGLILAMGKVAAEKEKFLRNYYLKAKRSIAKARAEGPTAWVFPADERRKGQQAALLRIIQGQGAEVHRLTAERATSDGKFGRGSYVVRMDQPYSRMADMMLDRQYYKPEDPRSYDDTGWTLGPLFDVATVRVKDVTLLSAPMERVADMAPPRAHDFGWKPTKDEPRIAIVHTWTNTQDEGWYRLAFDQLGVPYRYVSVHELRDTADLRAKYDVILLAPARGTGQSLVSGLPKVGDPIPWKPTAQYPNLGGPDTSDDIRGGIELEGVLHLRKFVENGGLLMCVGNMCRVPVEYGLVTGVSIATPKDLNAPGGVYLAERVDKTSPVLSGYGDTLGVYFNMNSTPLLALGGGAPGRGPRDADGGRPSGRGSLTDPDVIQGRPPYAPKEKPGDVPEGGTYQPPTTNAPRVLLRFADKDRVLMSGMISAAEELAGRPALVDCPVGKGHVLLYGINPMWRGQTVGSYALLFNAAMNYRNLSPAPKP